jgi:hypothetical protein
MTEEPTETEYEAPAVTVVGNVRDMTMGQIFASGQDNINFFGLFGS